MIELSIIVPVYNVRGYIDECITSVINAKEENIEIILVNDGSTDDSGLICDKYKEQDTRIKVIHQKNQGLSAARNTGIKNSIGKYIMFIDGDDFIKQGSISEIMEIIKDKRDVDIICGKMISYYQGKSIKEKFCLDYIEEDDKSGQAVLEYFFENIKYIMWSACRSIYKRELIEKNNLFFKVGITSEDLELIPRIYLNAKKVEFYNTPFYFYRQLRPNSIINTVNKKRFEDILEIIKSYIILLDGQSYTEKFKKCFLKKLANLYVSYILIIGQANIEEQSLILKEMIELEWIIKYSDDYKGKYLYISKKIIGIKGSYKLYSTIKKLKNKVLLV